MSQTIPQTSAGAEPPAYLPRPEPLDAGAPAVPAIDERSRRRPEFDAEGNWVTLADGQAWCLPKPLVRFVPTGEEYGFAPRYSYGGGFGEIVRRMHDAGSDDEWIGAHTEAAKFLLTLNYELTLEEVQALAPLGMYGRAAADPIREAVTNTVLGLAAPKPSSAGGD